MNTEGKSLIMKFGSVDIQPFIDPKQKTMYYKGKLFLPL